MNSLPDLRDTPVFVVGGGPSLLGFDFDRLPSGYVISPNASAFEVERSDAFVTIDKSFARNRAAEIRDLAKRKLCVVGLAATALHDLDFGDAYRTLHRRDIVMSPSLIEGLSGLNSGYAAINLAVIMGARDIHLLGFDMRPSVDRTHWHSGYPWHHSKHNKIFLGWAQQFHKMQTILKPLGVRVTNYTDDNGSGIDAFPVRDLKELPHEYPV